ncbi:MAG: hypothetical protein RL347_2275, partial [Actinomycetota bacterium]
MKRLLQPRVVIPVVMATIAV